MNEGECASCVYARINTSEEQEMPTFKCYRYPPTIVWDPNEEVMVQAYPDAWYRCGEYTAEKTAPVIGRYERIKHATLPILVAGVSAGYRLGRGHR